MLGAKRWDAQSALAADLIESAHPVDELFEAALAFAETQARLAKGSHGRKLFNSVKNQMKGHVMKSAMDYVRTHTGVLYCSLPLSPCVSVGLPLSLRLTLSRCA